MRTSNNKINPTVKEAGRGYNNNKKKVLFTDGLCHIIWFSIGHCIKSKIFHISLLRLGYFSWKKVNVNFSDQKM